MARYEVLLKRVTFSTAVVDANSIKEARAIVEQDGPHEHMLAAQIGGSDETTIVSVYRAEE